METDPIDRLIGQWKRERPELDASPMAVVGRILRLAGVLERSVEETLRPFGLSLWQFDVLATLRRTGTPYRLSPTQLMKEVMLSSGAMMNRIADTTSEAMNRNVNSQVKPLPADRELARPAR